MEKKLNLYLVSCVILTFVSAFSALLFFSFSFLPEPSAPSTVTTGFRELAVGTELKDPTLPLSDDLGDSYLDRITFLGESTTYGLQRYGLLKDGLKTDKVWTGATCIDGSVTSAGTLSLSPSIDQTRIFHTKTAEAITIGEALKRDKPQILIITLGLNNGASYYSEDEFKQCYRILLNSAFDASPDTVYILQSLFPVSAGCKIKAYTPERIVLCNSWIRDIAAEYSIRYLDTASVLTDANGYLFASFDNGGDGIHLNKDGLSTVLSYIRMHGITIPEENNE